MDQTDGIQSKKPLNQFQVKENKDRFGKIQPDEGWAWLVCFGAHLWICLVGGTLKLNGVIFVEFQDLYNVGATAASWIGFAFGICMLISGGAFWTFLVGGTLKCNGVILLEFQELFNASGTATSWIGFAFGIRLMLSAFTGGCMVDNVTHHNVRIYMSVLVILTALCVAVTAYMPTLPGAILTYGVLFGWSMGIADAAALSQISLYFLKRRTMAFGLVFSGTSLGSIILPILFATTSDYCGFRGSMLIFSAIWLHGLFVPVFSWPLSSNGDISIGLVHTNDMRTDPKHHHSPTGMSNEHIQIYTVSETYPGTEFCTSNHNQVEKNHMVSPDDIPIGPTEPHLSICDPFMKLFTSYGKFFSSPGIPFFVVSMFCGNFGYIGGLFIIPPLALEMGMNKLQTSVILTISSLAEIISRVVIGTLVDKYEIPKGPILISSYTATGVVAIVASLVSNPYTLYGYGIAIGGPAGIGMSLALPIMMSLIEEKQKGSASAMFTVTAGLVSALAPAIFGYVRDNLVGTYGVRGTYGICLYLGAAAHFLGIIFYLVTTSCNRSCKNARIYTI